MLLLMCGGNFNAITRANISENIREEIITSYLPTVYITASGVESGDLTYGVGTRWLLARYGGMGLEYREFQPLVTFAEIPYRMSGHAAGAYIFLETPAWKTFSVGMDFGGGILWDETEGLDITETWITSWRINLSKQLTQYFDITIWGSNRFQ